MIDLEFMGFHGGLMGSNKMLTGFILSGKRLHNYGNSQLLLEKNHMTGHLQ